MNETLKQALSDIPWGVWLFLIVQASAFLVWGVRIDGRITAAEQAIMEMRVNLRAVETDHRMMHSKVTIIEERQNRVIETNNYQQRQIDYIIQWFSPHVTPPGPLPPPPNRSGQPP